MVSNTSSVESLIPLLHKKHAQVVEYLNRALPRKKRLLNMALFGGALSALLTAAPAMGGKGFSEWLGNITGWHSPVWQLLCGLAALSSLTATLATQWLKSNNLEAQLSLAQRCAAKLEVLEVSLAAGQIEPQQAATEYIHCVEEVAFIQGNSGI